MTATNFKPGWLRYSEDDSSIIYQSSLKSASSITSPVIGAGGSISLLGGETYDADKGLLCGTTGGIDINAITGQSELALGGQITMEVESEFFGAVDGSNNTGGVDQDFDQYLISQTSTNISNDRKLAYWRDSVSRMNWVDNKSSILSALAYDDFVEFQISWQGTVLTYAINGEIIADVPNWEYFTDRMSRLWIGSRQGAARSGTDDGHMEDYYIRNLQISSRPAIFPSRPEIITMVGDSQISRSEPATGTPIYGSSNAYQGRAGNVLRAHFRKRGSDLVFDWKAIAGSTMVTKGIPDGNSVEEQRANILANNPDYIILGEGINDIVEGHTASAFDTAIKAEITAYLANGVQKAIVNTIAPATGHSVIDSTANRTEIDSYNTNINALPAWNNNVIVVDLFSRCGGHGNTNFVTNGQVTGSGTDLHLSHRGMTFMGDLWDGVLYGQL